MDYVEVISEVCKDLEYLSVFPEWDTGGLPEPDALENLSSFCDEGNCMSDFTPAGISQLVKGCPKLKTLVVNEVIERRLVIPRRITVTNEDKGWPVMH